MAEKRIIGISVIALLVAAMVGFIIGMGIGGHWGEKPFRAEQALIDKDLTRALDDKVPMPEQARQRVFSCALVARHHTEPVDNLWWQECLRGFAKDDT
jgi:hypothetical protein